MNVFMPCESIEESVRALDDNRLIKQILECKQIIETNLRVFGGFWDYGKGVIGYRNHPVVKHYRDTYLGFEFIATYGAECCDEFERRFSKEHAFQGFFTYIFPIIDDVILMSAITLIYAEGSIKSPYCIRETDNEKVFELFKQKLIKKWDNDKYPPKWTNREPPSWYKRNTFQNGNS